MRGRIWGAIGESAQLIALLGLAVFILCGRTHATDVSATDPNATNTGYSTANATSTNAGTRISSGQIQQWTRQDQTTGFPPVTEYEWYWDDIQALNTIAGGTLKLTNGNGSQYGMIFGNETVNVLGDGNNTFEVNSKNAAGDGYDAIGAGQGINIRYGTVNLLAGTIAGTIKSDGGSGSGDTTNWTINGTYTDLKISGSLTVTDTASNGAKNNFDIRGADFTGTILATNSGGNTVNFYGAGVSTEGANFSGLADLRGATGTQNINLYGGLMTGGLAGSITSVNNFYTSGGLSSGWMYGEKSDSDFWMNGGAIKNITGGAENNAADKDHNQYYAGSIVNVSANHGSGAADSEGILSAGSPRVAVIQNAITGAHANQIINVEELHVGRKGRGGSYQVGTGAVLEIGYYDGSVVSQLSSKKVNVYAGNTFIINPSVDIKKSYVEEFNVLGTATINKTTLQGSTGTALFNIKDGGILHGFGSYTHIDGDFAHNAAAANTIGKLTLESGSKLQPYNWDMFGVVAMNQNRTVNGSGTNGLDELKQVNYLHNGEIVFKSAIKNSVTDTRASMLSTRLFDNTSATYTQTNADRVGALSDWVTVNGVTNFTDVRTMVATAKAHGLSDESVNEFKAQYDPIFGFNYELVSKQEFMVTRGTDPDPLKNQYDFKILERTDGTAIKVGTELASDLFSRDIIKSDMLGMWDYEFRNGDKEVWVTYRMTAEHPSNGGLAKDALTPNSRAAAVVLDIWRYPFQTDYNTEHHGLLDADPSLGTGPNQSVADNHNNDQLADYGAGYNGNMNEFYAANQARYNNYQDYYIDDFTKLLLNMQYEVGDAHIMEEFLRQNHGESYASLANISHDLVNRLIGLRERNSMSALPQVEADLRQAAEQQAARATVASGDAYASVDTAVAGGEEIAYVCNPLRFWASAFGSKGRQDRNGYEYGYDMESAGGALGVIKELGDLYFGLTLGYGHAKTDFKELSANAKTDAYMAEALFGFRRGMGFAEVFGNYAYNDQDMQRYVHFNNYTGYTEGKYHDTLWGGGVRFGYQYLINEKWLFVPTIGVNYLESKNSAFEEIARYNMSVRFRFDSGAITRKTWRVPLMARLTRVFALGSFVLAPEVRAGITPILGDRQGTSRQAYVGMPINGLYFKSVGTDVGRYEAQFGASLELSRRGRFYVAANYDFMLREKSRDHNVSLQTGLNF